MYILLYNKDGENLMNNNGKWEVNYILLYKKTVLIYRIIMLNEKVFIYFYIKKRVLF
jgi:hypothetical protein